jgi:hypothetical protein
LTTSNKPAQGTKPLDPTQAKDSIQAHPTIAFAALAVARHLEQTTGWSTKKFVTTLWRYRTIQIQAGEHQLTAQDTLPDDAQQALNARRRRH